MATLSLKISLEGGAVVKTMQFDPSSSVYDACRLIREKILEAGTGDPKQYGLFLTSDNDTKKGIWLEASRSLDYYILRSGDLLHYGNKTRNLRVRMLDGTVKTLLVDDSQIVANLMVVICTKIGITNYDEYGLVREEQKEEGDPCEKGNYGTLTMRRKHQEKDRDAKMDQLRKKLRTDDEVNWVEPSQTLGEQGIQPSETVLLRRRLFYSDRNVDSRDPVQLNLLYVQARDAILAGTHPITMEKACEFAGIQCQIQFGDHKEDKHTPGFLDLKEFLPASYVKVKGVEKKVLKQHRQHSGLSELEAKVLYTKSARALPTYGVAFFLVKEKMKGKNKLVPRLLGVRADSVLRLDERTKETLQSWPLTTVRRWCASPNTFTLDFGDYSDQYYSVQTTEAEQILQVIAGYIDIILRRQRAKEHLGVEGDEGSAMLEDAVAPSKANIIQHDTYKSGKVNTESVAKPAVLRPGAEGAKPFAVGHVTGAQQTTVSGQIITGHAPPAASQGQQTKVTSVLTEPQRALSSTITSGYEIIKHTEESLTVATLPELGDDAASQKWRLQTTDTSRQLVTSQIAAMNAATAQIVTLTSGTTEEVDHTAVGAAITTITSNLPPLSSRVALLAALAPDGAPLLDAARSLCRAFTELLTAADPQGSKPRQNLLNAASKVGEASTGVLHTIGEETEEDKETQDILLSLAKAVANTTAALVLKAKHVAASCGEPGAQGGIIACATHAALATSQLVAAAKVVAPTLDNPACKEQLNNACRQVTAAVQRLLAACEAAGGGRDELLAAADQLTDALDRLQEHANMDRNRATAYSTTTVEHVMSAYERLSAAHSQPEVLQRARELGHATATLITDIKTEAESKPSDAQRRLLAAAKLLADATARMVEAARQCATSPEDREKQEALRRAAEELRFITADYAQGQDIVRSQIARLSQSAMQTASSAGQLAAAAHSATTYNTNTYTQETLLEECKLLTSQVPRVVDAVKVSSLREGSAAAQLDLISACDSLLQPSGHAVAAARAALPTVSDAHAHKHLSDTAQQLTQDAGDLRSAVSRARTSCRGLELDAAAQLLRELPAELQQQPRPLPGQTAEWASSTLNNASRSAGAATAALVSAARAAEPAAAGAAAADLSSHLKEFTKGVRASAALAEQPEHSEKLLSSGRHVLESSLTLVETVQRYLATSETVHIQHIITTAKQLNQDLERTVEAVPAHSELDIAMENINETLNILNMNEFPPSDRNYGELQSELTTAAAELSQLSSSVAWSAETPGQLARAARGFGDQFNTVAGLALEMCRHTEDVETRTLMVNSMKTVTVNSSKLLSTAKSVSQDLNRPNAKNQLAAAARDVTDSINRLLDVCTEATPGQKECEAVLRNVAAMAPLLRAPDEPVTDLGYFCTLDQLVTHSKTLSEGMSGMAHSIKRGAQEQFSTSVQATGAALCRLLEGTAQAAYLVAVSDETSVAGRPGLVDRAQFARAAAAIDQACRVLADSSSAQQQVLSAATIIAKHTSAICNACRVASSKTSRAADKRHFVQSAKDVANCTAALVKRIKTLDADYTEENRSACAEATAPLQDAVRSLCQFADSPEFAAAPARLSPAARQQQQPILQCGRNIITASCSMIEAAKVLALSPSERAHWQALAQHSKTVSDNIKALVTNIREKAPGQRQCACALQTLSSLRRSLEQCALAEQPAPPAGNTLEGFSELIESSSTEILERLEPLRVAAKGEAENLGHAVVQMVSYIEPLVTAAIGCHAQLSDSRVSAALLDATRTVLEAAAALVQAAGDAAGNPRATSIHPEVDSSVALCRRALSELSSAARELSAARGAVRPLLDAVARSQQALTTHRMSLLGSFDETASYVDYQTRMAATAKDIARLANDMTAKSATDASRLVQLGNDVCQKYCQLAADSGGASATTPHADLAASIRSAVLELGEQVSDIIKAGGACRMSATADNQRAVADSAKRVNEKVMSVLSALQQGSRGTQACIDAAATVAAIIGDLDTTIMFASAGTLQSDNEADSFSQHREAVLKTAKTLVEDTKRLVGGATGGQDELAAAADAAVATIVQLCEVVKQGAISLGCNPPDRQVLLLNAARDVAAALRDLAAATAAASPRQADSLHVQNLKTAAKVMVTNVTSLLKTVKAVEDEHMRGIRALESTIESISQEVNVLMSPQAPKSTATPEELIRHTRLMTGATAAAVAAGATHKQQQLTQSAHLGRATVRDLLTTCKAAAFTAETEELKQQTLEAGRNAALAYRALLVALLGTAEDKAQLPELSRHVASAAAELIAYADKLKGADWVDPEDPTVIAENELLSAAASIDAAARKLDSLRPRQVQVEADENLNFDEMILSAARSIITATSALVRAASAAQRELIDQGKVARRPTSSSDDGQWSEGLISAARLVAAAAHSLVEASNALVCGAGSEERLISASRQVAQSTAQLLVACKVKADPSSESTRRLQAAGAQVIRSTDNLVVAARDAMSHEEERSLVLNRRMVGGIAQEIDARSEILRIEKELEEARGRLNAIRQAKYRLKTGDTSGDETDTDVYIGGYSSDASATPHRFKTLNSSFANTTYSPNSTQTSQHNTQNSTNLSQHIGQLNQSIHGTSSPGYSRLGPNAGQTPPTSPGYKQAGSNAGPTPPPPPRPSSFGQNNSYSESQYSQTNGSFGQSKTVQSPTFSSFRPQEETPKQSYEGFTTRTESEVTSEVSETVVVKSLQLPQVRTALLVTDDSATTTIFYKREKPPPPPRKFTLGTKYAENEKS